MSKYSVSPDFENIQGAKKSKISYPKINQTDMYVNPALNSLASIPELLSLSEPTYREV